MNPSRRIFRYRLPPAERTALRVEHLRLRGELPTTTEEDQ